MKDAKKFKEYGRNSVEIKKKLGLIFKWTNCQFCFLSLATVV
jgi:hypothetical protein